jgi:hypothetical protein
LQDAILHELTAGIEHVDAVDLPRADALVRARLTPFAA